MTVLFHFSLFKNKSTYKVTLVHQQEAFTDKQTLFGAALERYMTRRGQLLSQLLTTAPSGREGVRQLFGWYASSSAGPEGQQGCLLVHAATTTPAVEQRVARQLAARPDSLPADVVAVYVQALQASSAALSASFNYYWALGVGGTLRAIATQVQGLLISDCGHFVPEPLLATLTSFLVPYRQATSDT